MLNSTNYGNNGCLSQLRQQGDFCAIARCRFVMDLATELGIELLFLPPYSTHFNLIERLWRFVKKKCLYSQYDKTFPDFQQAISDCIAEADGEYKQELASLLTLKFQVFENVTL